MHDSSGNMAVNLNFIYLHRNFVNRSFLLLNKKWNSLQVFTLTSEEGGLVTITFEINMASLVSGQVTKYRNGSDLWLDDKKLIVKVNNLYLNSLLVSVVNRVSKQNNEISM